MASTTMTDDGHTAYPYGSHDPSAQGAEPPVKGGMEPVHVVTAGQVGLSARLDAELLAVTQPQTRIFLRPLANPACLATAAFFGGSWMFSTLLCDWYHESQLQSVLPLFVLLLGGLAQFIAGFYGFPARDSLVTVFHVSWGSFYMAYGLLYAVQLLGDNTALPGLYDNQAATATWLVVMAALTWVVFLAGLGRDLLLTLICFMQAVGATLVFGGWYSNNSENRRAVKAGGYFMMLAALLALVQVFLLLVAESDSSTAVWSRVAAWQQTLPWNKARYPVRIPVNEAGIKKGL